MGKRIAACLLAALLAIGGGMSALAAAPTVTSQSVCMMDADTGEILYEKDAYVELPMASVTKVMTALIVLENGDLQGTTTATNEAMASVDLDSTRVGFVAGETLSIDELMYCMLVYSANDAANILAAAVGGTVENFVSMMNERAEELGCTHTHFVNPNGLDADGHYTCAHDMALITYAVNQYPEFTKYAGAVSYTLPADNVIGEGWQVQTKVDALVQSSAVYDARVYAAKTGWTTKAHNTYVSCARTQSGANLITVLLNCPMKQGIFTETTALLDYADTMYPQVTVTGEDYKKTAKKAARKSGGKLDTSALPDITLRLPSGLSAEDLSYSCTATGTGVELQIGIAEESRAAYQAETGLDGTQPLLTTELPVVQTKTITSGSAGSGSAQAADETTGSFWDDIRNLSDTEKRALLTAGIVVAAILVMLVMTVLLRFLRWRNARRSSQSRKK